MIPVMSRAIVIAAVAAVLVGACLGPPPAQPMQLDGNRLTVDNRTDSDWSSVEIWLNQQYRVTVPTISARSRFTVSLDSFVAGFGQRFNFSRQQITDLRLVAKGRDGEPVELRYEFESGRLKDALKGFR
jgi:hypothetical protein